MAYDIGPKIGIEGEAEFRQAINGINTNLKTLGTEMLAVTSSFDKNEKSTESLTAKNKVLNKQIDEQKNKLSELEKGLKASAEKYGENDTVTQGWRQAINKATADLNNMQRELTDNTKALDSMAIETKSTEQSLNELENQASKTNAVLSKDDAIKNLKSMATQAAVAGAAVGAALIGIANSAMNNADELQRQSDVTGLSAERLQELTYAGNNLGVELDVITGAQAKLTKNMYAAIDGTGAQAEAFAALGISVVDSNGQMRDAETVMNEAFTALNGVGNETERDALAMQIFGKSAMEMNPMIKAGGDELARLSEEARTNGSVMSNEAVAGLDTFGDTIDNLKNDVLGAFGEKFAEILPNVQEFLDKLIELPQWIEENETKLILLGVAVGTVTALVVGFNVQQVLLASGMTLWTAIAAGATAVTTSLGAAFAFLTSPIGIAIVAIGAVIAIGVALYKNWDTVQAKATELKENILGAFDSLKTNTIDAWDKIKTTIADIVSGLAEDAITWGRNMVEGLWNGIANKADWVREKVQGFVEIIGSTIKDFFGIASPSKLMEEYGQYIDEGLAVGINGNAGKPIGAMNSVAGSINQSLQTITDTIGLTTEAIKNMASEATMSKIKAADNESDSQRSLNQSTYKKKQDEELDENESEIKAISKRNNVDLGVAQSMFEKNEIDKILGNVPKYASGTSFHPGGLAWVGELGRELVELPRGSKVYSNSDSQSIGNQRPISLYIGTYIGDDYGLKQLERKLRGIRIGEDNRLGVATG